MEHTTYTVPKGFGRTWRLLGLALLAFNVALFVWAVADWLGWLPFERGFQPLRMVYLSGALLIQAVASIIQRRSMAGSLVLIVASMALLALSMTVRI